jgi:archaemetzincin
LTSESLTIVQLGSTIDYPLEKLRDKVAERFRECQVNIRNSLDTPIMAFDSYRNQYHSTRILVYLEEMDQAALGKHILGVASFDLYVPGMNFVFGEARCPGRTAIISTFRLRSGRSQNSELFESRVVKEAVHEIGHMMGLKHCPDNSCVMYFSERLSDTDRKQDRFCSHCERKMRWLEVE